MTSERRAHRPAVMGTRGMVSTAHPLATAAAMEMFWHGGNAVDAAVAAAATLNVVGPFMSGIGGDGLLLLTLGKTGERRVLDFMGRTPFGATPEACTAEDLQRGPKSLPRALKLRRLVGSARGARATVAGGGRGETHHGRPHRVPVDS